MAIKLNTTEPIPEYNKDAYFKKFIPLIFEYAPEFASFSFRDLLIDSDLSKEERLIFGNMNIDLRKYFVGSGFANTDGSRKIILTESGRNKKNGTHNDFNLNINNDFKGSTIGQVNQSSEKIELKSSIKQKIVPKTVNESSKKSWTEILAWIIGIIAGLVAIYEFILKEFII